MDKAQTLRPKMPSKHQVEPEVREKCVLCCGLYCACWSAALLTFITGPCVWAVTRYQGLPKCTTWLQRIDRYGFLPVPFFFITFIHQSLMSQGLWSPRKRSIADLNWHTGAISVGVQAALIASGTALSRFVLPKFSRTYRLLLWDYNRIRRTMQNKNMPGVIGSLSENFDVIHAMWYMLFYHLFWGVACAGADSTNKTRFAIWYRGMNYSKYCSPRWREWRETEIQNKLDTHWQPLPTKRWGSIFNYEEWRDRR